MGLVVPRARRRGSQGISGGGGGNGLSHFLSLLREEQRPLKAGVMEAEKNTDRPSTGAIEQIRRREGKGRPRGRTTRRRGALFTAPGDIAYPGREDRAAGSRDAEVGARGWLVTMHPHSGSRSK